MTSQAKARRLQPRLFLPAENTRSDRHWRDDPDEATIAAIGAAYRTEGELHGLLDRKLRRRNSGPYRIPTLEEMSAFTRAFLTSQISGGFEISDEGWLTGGASKMQFGFTLSWIEGGARRVEKLVVRMDPAESLNTTSRRREFQIIAAMKGVVPVPPCFWMDPEGEWFPEPAIIYGFVDGVTAPSTANARVSGTGTHFAPELREKLAPQFTRYLAAIHSHDWRSLALDAFDVPRVGTTDTTEWQLGRALRVWEEDRGEDVPAVECVANWLRDNMPKLDVISPLHGDYRTGNYLFNEERGEITAWLDWERAYLGDRHRDLAWATTRLFGNMADDGKTFLVSGLVPEEQFLDDYQRLSGLEVDPKRLRYYRIFNSYQLVVSILSTTYRVIRLSKSHQDVLLAIVEGAAYPIADELLRAIEEEY